MAITVISIEDFRAWFVRTAEANYDQAWLDYQHQIGLRHHARKKRDGGRTTHASSRVT